MPDLLYLSQSHIEDMVAHVEACAPEEGCGLLAGTDRRVELTILITNQDHSPLRYNMDLRELVKAYYTIEDRGLQLLATFHSHPAGPSMPSATDLAPYSDPDVFMVILSRETGKWNLKGFKIENGTSLEIELRIV